MDEINKINLSEQTKFRLDEICKIENYFIEEISQKKSCSKKLNKNVIASDYIEKVLIALSATSVRSINYFIYKYYWSTSWSSKCKFNNWNS